MNKAVIFLGTRERQWGCKSLAYEISSRNKINKEKNKQTKWLSNVKKRVFS